MGCSYSTSSEHKLQQPQLIVSVPPSTPAAQSKGEVPARIKICLLGDTGVGKSCLAVRYVKGQFSATAATIGAAFLSHTMTLPGGRTVKLEIWDTAGQERYLSLAPLYYRSAHAAAVVYDITSPDSFERSKYWIHQLAAHNSSAAAGSLVMILVGNKSDLSSERAVSEQEAQAFADSCGMLFIETSAKTGACVGELFEAVALKLAGGLPVSSNAVA